jgi:hypothetical protein
MSLERRIFWFCLILAMLLCRFSAAAIDRPADPVVLKGSDVPLLLGAAPGDIVAFRYNGGWEQVPVQVDERDTMPFDRLYNNLTNYGTAISGEFYTDPNTFAGPDSNPALDTNDEIALMASDTGSLPPAFSEPAGVLPGSGVQLRVSDAENGGKGYLYLFRRATALDPGAGRQYVAYAFNLLSGDYRATYRLSDGPNPENSTVTTPAYAVHFSDRWILDEMRVYAGGATGVDILDRRTNKFAPSNCGRSEDTFSDAEGAFYVNKSGPVRALRGYIGANSGPITQREHVFYAAREDQNVYLRVHPIGGIMNLIDYSPAATGMAYSHNGSSPVTIDGANDSVPAGPLDWELVTGPQGSVVVANNFITDTGIVPTSYYLDDTTPADSQCTGDGFAYGTSGLWVTSSIPNTDPIRGAAARFEIHQSFYYDAPGLTAADADLRTTWARVPLAVTAAAWTTTDSDGDGVADALDAFPSNPSEQADADEDGLGDAFEQRIIDANPNDNIATLPDVLPTADYDHDGHSNAQEFTQGTDPTTPPAAMPTATPPALALLATLLLIAARRKAVA